MSTTVLDCVKKAQNNFHAVGQTGMAENPVYSLAMVQLKIAITALENGRDANYVLQDSPFGEVKP